MNEPSESAKARQYFLLSFLLWVFVDFGTAGGFRVAYFEKYGAALLFFYLGSPLVFSFLIFKMRWGGRRLFLATLATIFVVEVLFTRNPLVTTFPALLAGIPLAVAVYTPLIYFPLWLVRKQMRQHWLPVLVSSAITLMVTLLTMFGQANH
ncbi:MAG: hypothetical protein ACOYYS_13270 [Chloroflexota bacterium]